MEEKDFSILRVGHDIWDHAHTWERKLENCRIFQVHQRILANMVVGITSNISITFIDCLFSDYTIDWDVLHHSWTGRYTRAVLYPWNNTSSSKIRYCLLLIATVDYECWNHCNNFDDVSHSKKNDMWSKLEIICQGKEMEESLVDYAQNCLEYVTRWGVSIPTTCCYQFIILEKLNEKQFEIIQFFVDWN